MGRPLSYAEAVRMLGAGESRLISVLDWLAGAGLAGGGLDLFGARDEAVRLGRAVTRDLGDRIRGLNRLTRTERLRAAHTVIVLAAYFEELPAAVPQLRLGRLDARRQVVLAGAQDGEAGRRGMAHALTRAEIPAPGPSRTYESIRRELLAYYGGLGESLLEFAAGLPEWAELDEDARAEAARVLGGVLPERALAGYEEMLRRLAVDCLEFGIWIEHWEHRTARAELAGGMATLEELLASMTGGRAADAQRTALSRSYQASLHRPITAGGDVPSGLTIPSLEEGYVDHRLRAAVMDATARPSQESWWAGVPLYREPSRFFAAYLTSPEAVSTPMLVLGQPGSGKSVLTRMLAASLPPDDFLPILVELRHAPAESDLQSCIEDAVRQATGERTSWPRLVEAGGGALPVVILDGFDELLQATGVTQTDFLMKVTAFQEREADQGRPVAVVVTSRTAVVDRARIPHGSVVACLEPFDDAQIRAWVENWRAFNGAALRRRGLEPLPAEVALAHRELAEQPLLLLMLALYDAEDNALQRRPAVFDRTDLYERLLREFASRQIRKQAPDLDDESHRRAVERELLQLSIVGFAMFNRRSQWVSDADLDADLRALRVPGPAQPGDAGLSAPLSAAQIVVGRFFFVHETQVTRDGRPLHTYEFLHATFGEFLIARLVAQILADLAAQAVTAARSPLGAQVNDDLLHALLSFASLTARAPVIGFLDALLARLTTDQRRVLAGLLLDLFRGSLHARTGSSYGDYRPLPLNVPNRHAAWSMNLVVLAVLVADELTGAELFAGQADDHNPANLWRPLATLWRSQLIGEEWAGFFRSMALHREWDGDQRTFRICRAGEDFRPEPLDAYWTYNIPPGHAMRDGLISYRGHEPLAILLKSNMNCFATDDTMVHALEPLASAFPSIANVHFPLGQDRTISATHALLAGLVAEVRGDDRSGAFEDLARVAHTLSGLPPKEEHDLYLKAALKVLVSAAEGRLVAKHHLMPLVTGAHGADSSRSEVGRLRGRLRELLHSG